VAVDYRVGQIVLSLKTQHHRFDTELERDELAAIGYVTVQWAQLENVLLSKTIQLAEEHAVPIPEDATALSVKRRLRAYRELVKSTINDNAECQKLLDLITKIGGVERSRNRVVHGVWDWERSEPALLKASSAKAPHNFQEHFDFHKLIKVAHRIGELSSQLQFPGGEAEALEHQVQATMQHGFSVSRRFALEITGRDPEHPRRYQPIRAHRKPRPASRERS
jgi:hypothetical protein